MNMAPTPSQLAAHQAAKERERRRRIAAKAVKQDTATMPPRRISARPKKPSVVIDLDIDMFWTCDVYRHTVVGGYSEFAGGGSPYIGRHSKRSLFEIASDVLKGYPGITIDDVRGASRRRNIIKPRHHVVYAIRIERPEVSLLQIGRWLGGRDHTTVLNSEQVWRKHLAENGHGYSG